MPLIAEIQSLNPARPERETWEGKGITEEALTQKSAYSLSRPSTHRLRETPVFSFDS